MVPLKRDQHDVGPSLDCLSVGAGLSRDPNYPHRGVKPLLNGLHTRHGDTRLLSSSTGIPCLAVIDEGGSEARAMSFYPIIPDIRLLR